MQARRRNTVVGAPAATPASGGMPGWQIVLFVLVVLLAAALAVALYLIRAMRQRVTAA